MGVCWATPAQSHHGDVIALWMCRYETPDLSHKLINDCASGCLLIQQSEGFTQARYRKRCVIGIHCFAHPVGIEQQTFTIRQMNRCFVPINGIG